MIMTTLSQTAVAAVGDLDLTTRDVVEELIADADDGGALLAELEDLRGQLAKSVEALDVLLREFA